MDILDEEVEVFLEHFGVKGMHWGIRNPTNAPRRTNKEAHKDAAEFARAKMFYGEGAGTRRKLINKSVEAKKKRDPAYAKAFEQHLMGQDISKHATKAVSERKRIDRTQKTKKTAGAVARRVTGEWGTQAAFVALAFGGAAFLKTPKGQRISRKGISKLNDAKDSILRRKGARRVSKIIRDMTA
jgi:hypothetical protein